MTFFMQEISRLVPPAVQYHISHQSGLYPAK